MFRQATFYLVELFRQATFYLVELFRQATFYLAELFRQATFFSGGTVSPNNFNLSYNQYVIVFS